MAGLTSSLPSSRFAVMAVPMESRILLGRLGGVCCVFGKFAPCVDGKRVVVGILVSGLGFCVFNDGFAVYQQAFPV